MFENVIGLYKDLGGKGADALHEELQQKVAEYIAPAHLEPVRTREATVDCANGRVEHRFSFWVNRGDTQRGILCKVWVEEGEARYCVHTFHQL